MNVGNMILRGATGAWILNSGLGKLGMDAGTAGHLKAMAAQGVPAVNAISDEDFAKLLPAAEIALGATLLLPFVPSRLAGLGLTGFAAGMLSMYFRSPEMTKSDGVRWTQEGTALAKDMWLAAIGAALVLGKK